MAMNLQYIMCAPGMIRMEHYDSIMKEIFEQYLIDHQEYGLGLLFNAMTEAKIADKIHNRFEHISKVITDSGGLQLVTLGYDAEKANEKKKDIYYVQAHFSDVAMCFDEMPIRLTHVIGGGQSRLDKSNRRFVKSLIQESALKTANNIKEQIAAFVSYDSPTKIMLICQGNGVETYKEYCETIWNALTSDEQEHIYGLALAGSSNGSGILDKYDMLYSSKEFDLPDHIKSNIHLLGVGSYQTLTPLLSSTDYFSYMHNVSFDSSSAVRLYAIDGRDHNKERIEKTFNQAKVLQVYSDMYTKYKKYFDILAKYQQFNVETIIEKATYFSSKNDKKLWSYYEDDYTNIFLCLNLFVTVAEIERVFETLALYTRNANPIFKSIHSYKDFEYYRRDLSRIMGIQSKKIKIVESEEDFEIEKTVKHVFDTLF